MKHSFRTVPAADPVQPLDPGAIPKYADQLVMPPVYVPSVIRDPVTRRVLRHDYVVSMVALTEQILPPPFPRTRVWGYAGLVRDPITGASVFFRNAPGATFEAIRGVPISVTWVNDIIDPHMFAVDPTLHWANPNNIPMPEPPFPPFPPGFPLAQAPVPTIPHLHGGEVRSDSDGHPEAWFTFYGPTGQAFSSTTLTYPNAQPPTTLWYHDHALGITRLNVFAGLAGFYLLRDPSDPIAPHLPSGRQEIPVVIQDRAFNTDGSLNFPSVGDNPDIHPYWVPEFFGNTIMVNGRVWPNLNVTPRQYRLRFLNGSNARFYNLSLSNGQEFIQIGAEGGYLPEPVTLHDVLIAPGERADILIDFSRLELGTTIRVLNNAPAPFPSGDLPDPDTTGQIMQFTVVDGPVVHPSPLPPILNQIPQLVPNRPVRVLTLNEVPGPNGPVQVLLNGQRWAAPISELPQVGSTEDWQLVNLTMDTHPIHLHLVQFQLMSRQLFDVNRYTSDWTALNGEPPLLNPTVSLAVEPYFIANPIDPDPNETGWKDTVRANPDQVTTIRTRWAPLDANPALAQPGTNLYPFDPTIGPGYAWHCHILDHEDNEMMRPYKVVR